MFIIVIYNLNNENIVTIYQYMPTTMMIGENMMVLAMM